MNMPYETPKKKTRRPPPKNVTPELLVAMAWTLLLFLYVSSGHEGIRLFRPGQRCLLAIVLLPGTIGGVRALWPTIRTPFVVVSLPLIVFVSALHVVWLTHTLAEWLMKTAH